MTLTIRRLACFHCFWYYCGLGKSGSVGREPKSTEALRKGELKLELSNDPLPPMRLQRLVLSRCHWSFYYAAIDRAISTMRSDGAIRRDFMFDRENENRWRHESGKGVLEEGEGKIKTNRMTPQYSIRWVAWDAAHLLIGADDLLWCWQQRKINVCVHRGVGLNVLLEHLYSVYC